MTDHANELRRYSRKIGHPAGDVPSVMLAAAEEIERLAARLEASEKSDAESLTMYRKARDERDALRVENEALAANLRGKHSTAGATYAHLIAERDALRAALRHEAGCVEAAKAEIKALRAKVAEMEQQEPVAEIVSFGSSDLKEVAWKKGKMPALGSKLYALPGAQPAPKGVDGWKEGVESAARLIDQKAELYAIRFGHDDLGGLSFGTGPHAEIKMDHYTSMIELADEVRATLAAAPKPEGE